MPITDEKPKYIGNKEKYEKAEWTSPPREDKASSDYSKPQTNKQKKKEERRKKNNPQ